METRRIGSLSVSVVGLGCNNFGWRIDAMATAAVIDAALDAGINFLDTADIYGGGQSEEFIGQALGARRDRVVLATKFGMKFDEQRHGAKPAYVRQALEDSLRRLRTDRIDLYQLHSPDPETPIADTLGALDPLVTAGKVREIGCSNFTAAQLREAKAAAGTGARFVSVQNHFSLLHREPEAEVLPECVKEGLAFIPYFPLANGLLSGKYRRGHPFPKGSRGGDAWGPKIFTEENLMKVEALAEYAEAHGHTMLELAMSWLASKPSVASVIAGAKTPEQATANASSAGWRMTRTEFDEIDAILRTK
jgi:aryl-alcohol dehydrogenase-like predicted oxidoreductase